MAIKHSKECGANIKSLSRLILAIFGPFEVFPGIWRANMGQKWPKTTKNHLFEHPKWARNKFA